MFKIYPIWWVQLSINKSHVISTCYKIMTWHFSVGFVNTSVSNYNFTNWTFEFENYIRRWISKCPSIPWDYGQVVRWFRSCCCWGFSGGWRRCRSSRCRLWIGALTATCRLWTSRGCNCWNGSLLSCSRRGNWWCPIVVICCNRNRNPQLIMNEFTQQHCLIATNRFTATFDT